MAKILVIDNDPNDLVLLQRALAMLGHHEVALLEDPRSTLEVVQKSPPDLLILDLRMPYISGVEVLEHIKAAGFTFPIIMLTGDDDAGVHAKCLNLGASDFVLKPVDLRVLAARVRKILVPAR